MPYAPLTEAFADWESALTAQFQKAFYNTQEELQAIVAEVAAEYAVMPHQTAPASFQFSTDLPFRVLGVNGTYGGFPAPVIFSRWTRQSLPAPANNTQNPYVFEPLDAENGETRNGEIWQFEETVGNQYGSSTWIAEYTFEDPWVDIPPDLVFEGTVGTPLTATPGVWGGAPLPLLSYELFLEDLETGDRTVVVDGLADPSVPTFIPAVPGIYVLVEVASSPASQQRYPCYVAVT